MTLVVKPLNGGFFAFTLMRTSKTPANRPIQGETLDQTKRHVGIVRVFKEQSPSKEHLIEMANFLYARYKSQKTVK